MASCRWLAVNTVRAVADAADRHGGEIGGSRAVRLPIHAPLIPARNSMNGTTQQEAAASPARMPPTDRSAAALDEPARFSVPDRASMSY